jgi:hypothetical protein
MEKVNNNFVFTELRIMCIEILLTLGEEVRGREGTANP